MLKSTIYFKTTAEFLDMYHTLNHFRHDLTVWAVPLMIFSFVFLDVLCVTFVYVFGIVCINLMKASDIPQA